MTNIYEPMTKSELKSVVLSFYNVGSYMDLDKASKIFELEFGFKPEIVDKEPVSINSEIFNDKELIQSAKREHFEYLYEVQQSGIVNMFMARPFLLGAFELKDSEAENILNYYIRNYNKIYKGK